MKCVFMTSNGFECVGRSPYSARSSATAALEIQHLGHVRLRLDGRAGAHPNGSRPRIEARSGSLRHCTVNHLVAGRLGQRPLDETVRTAAAAEEWPSARAPLRELRMLPPAGKTSNAARMDESLALDRAPIAECDRRMNGARGGSRGSRIAKGSQKCDVSACVEALPQVGV
jgi:hypothetical protein